MERGEKEVSGRKSDIRHRRAKKERQRRRRERAWRNR